MRRPLAALVALVMLALLLSATPGCAPAPASPGASAAEAYPRGPIHLMLEQADGPGRRFRTATLEHPYGRGINLQIEVSDVDLLHAQATKAGATIHVSLEERWYLRGDQEAGIRQFVVIDPDGYLLRFCTSLGRRPARLRGETNDVG